MKLKKKTQLNILYIQLLIVAFLFGILAEGNRKSEYKGEVLAFPQVMQVNEITQLDEINQFGSGLFKEDWHDFQKIIKCESNWRTDVVSRTRDVGLTQINSVHGIRSDWLKDFRINLIVAHKLWITSGAGPWRSSYNCHHIK